MFSDELERKRDAKHFGLISWSYGFPITKKEETVCVCGGAGCDGRPGAPF